MITPDFTIKRSEVGNVISAQFLDRSGVAINCSTNTARKFFVRQYGGLGAIVIDGSTFTFSNATLGLCSYAFTSGDLAAMQPSPRGDAFFKAEFQVTMPGIVITTPTDPVRPFLIIKFEDDLSD